MVEFINRASIAVWMRLRRDEGQTFVEYAVITAVVALGAIAGLTVFKDDLATAFSDIANALGNAIP